MKTDNPTGKIHHITTYNEGLIVYLYDDSLLDKLAYYKDLPALLESHKGTRFRRVSQSGTIVAYELRQDDSLSIMVKTGLPLTKEEMEEICALPPLTAYLRIPSGRLAVECANSFRLDPDCEGEPPEEGAVVEVPPGEYIVHIYHIDLSLLPSNESGNYRGPLQYIVLTPAEPTDFPSMKNAWLPYKVKKKSTKKKKFDLSWVGQYTIVDGVFNGQFVKCHNINDPCINLGRSAELKMGLRLGAGILVEYENVKMNMVFMSRLDRIDYEMFYGTEARKKIEHISKVRIYRDIDGEEKLLSSHLVGKDQYNFLKGIPKEGTPVKITVTSPPDIPIMDLSMLEKWSVNDGIISGEILKITSMSVAVNIPPEAFEKINAVEGERFLFELGKTKHTFHYMVPHNKLTPGNDGRLLVIQSQVKKVERGYIDVITGETTLYPDDDWEKLVGMLHPPEEYPWVGEFREYWEAPEHKVLILQPLPIKELVGTRYSLIPHERVGGEVRICKIGSEK